MKANAAVISLLSLVAATPLTRRQAIDSENGWDNVVSGQDSAACADLAVIFARGTFDSGNIGPWVGGPFRDALVSRLDSVVFTGVSSDDYPADLAGYIEEGGSQSCADSLGAAVQSYVATCPDSRIAITGWSQGALCARKSLNNLGDAVDNVIAFTTFGDPVGVWSNEIDFPPVPNSASEFTYCQTTTPDPLCTDPLADFPTDPIELIDRLVAIWEDVDQADLNDAQWEAVKDLLVQLPDQAFDQLDTLAGDILNGDLRRWLLTPEHFWYGIDGTVETAADDIVAAFNAV